MALTYSSPLSLTIGNTWVNFNKTFKGDILRRSIQLYRMWFFFVRLTIDCGENQIELIDPDTKQKTKVKIDEVFYEEWDLERIKTDTFDVWWNDKKSLFIRTKPTIIDKIEDDSDRYFYLKIHKGSKVTDVTKVFRQIIVKDSYCSKFGFNKQHKYLPTHMKYNVFVWNQLGFNRKEICELIETNYKHYSVRKPKWDDQGNSIRRILRNTESLIIDTSLGNFGIKREKPIY